MDVSTPNYAEVNPASAAIINENSNGKTIGSAGNSTSAGISSGIALTGISSGIALTGSAGIADISRPPRAPIHGLALDPFDGATGSQSPTYPSQGSDGITGESGGYDSEQSGRNGTKRARAAAPGAATHNYNTSDSHADHASAGPERMTSRSGGSRSEGEDYSHGMDMGEYGKCAEHVTCCCTKL